MADRELSFFRDLNSCGKWQGTVSLLGDALVQGFQMTHHRCRMFFRQEMAAIDDGLACRQAGGEIEPPDGVFL